MKAVIYVRVSSKEQKQEGYSIPAQKKLLSDYARAKGFKIAKEFEDDETAKSAGRTGFGQMVEYLKQNPEINTILVEKTDRLYRNFKDYVIIEDLGVSVYLVKENEVIGKTASSHQKFIHGIKVLMAKNYIDNLSEEIRKGYNQKAEDGIYPSSTLPIGYKLGKDGDKTVPVVDEENKELVIKMFEYYSTGRFSLVSLINRVKTDGLFVPERLPKGIRMRTISQSSAHRVLRNVFYYGDFMWKGQIRKGTHTPLVSKELWDRVQGMLNKSDENGLPKYNTLPFAFKGLLVCGECGRTITAEHKTKPSGLEYNYYRCTRYQTNCKQLAVREEDLERQIVEALDGLKMPQQAVDDVKEGLKQSLSIKRNIEDKRKQQLEEEKAKLEKRLDALYEDKVDEVITTGFYTKKSEEYSERIKELDGLLSKYTQANLDYYDFGVKTLELAKKASFLYKNAKPEEKQELLGFLLSHSVLFNKKALFSYKKPFAAIAERVSSSDWWSWRELHPRPKAETSNFYKLSKFFIRRGGLTWLT